MNLAALNSPIGSNSVLNIRTDPVFLIKNSDSSLKNVYGKHFHVSPVRGSIMNDTHKIVH